MTVDTSSGGTVAPYDPSMDYGEGLEDVGVSDIVIPRLRIIHKEGVFQDNLSKQKFSELEVIILGLVKQRIMWDKDPEEGERPLCKSPDFEHGFPNLNPDLPANKRFPWKRSNFEPEQAQPLYLQPGQSRTFPEGYTSNGLPTLPCVGCKFKEWGVDPDSGKSTPPKCNEQHTYSVLYSPDEGESWIAALYTVQRTGLKPSKSYISSFAQTKTPMFTVKTRLTLSMQSKGSVEYSVPGFQRMEATDRNMWPEYADRQRKLRAFLRSAPRPQGDEGEEDPVTMPSDNKNTAPPTAPPVATPPKPAAASPAASKPAVAEPPVQASPAASVPEPKAATPSVSEPVAEDGEEEDPLPF